MSGGGGGEQSAEADLTPMLDLVFQLITFFMLVIDFKGKALDMSLRLPVVGSARPVDTKGTESFVILNIDSKGRLMVYGTAKDPIAYVNAEAAAVRNQHPNIEPGKELPVTVVIRSDLATPFKMLNEVITECQKNGFLKYALRAKDK